MQSGNAKKIDHERLSSFVTTMWDSEIVPELIEYIKIPNLSPAFDQDWASVPHMESAVRQLSEWAKKKISVLPGATLEILRLEGRTPLIIIDIPGEGSDVALLYGHLDKQPEMTGWAEGKGPWTPVIEGEKLYGRGGADDGYAMYAAITSILALHEQNVAYARSIIIIEASEESGSPDLPAYMDILAEKIENTNLVVCLDSGCGDYDRLWLTTSLRGLTGGELRVDVLEEGVHSGDASGVVPSSMRVMRRLLDRVEDAKTGEVLIPGLHAEIPKERIEQAHIAAEALGVTVHEKYPFAQGVKPASNDLTELLLNKTWRPALAVTGLAGAPPPSSAGSVLRPYTAAKLSMRLPPTVDSTTAEKAIKSVLESDPPYGAKVQYVPDQPGTGWNATPTAPWLMDVLNDASQKSWGNPAAMVGEGGTIPFMSMLGDVFPGAQFVVTGVLGPHSNAHGPNEFLHLPTGRRVTEAVAYILAAHLEN